LQYSIFSKLQILKIRYALPKWELLTNFLENNGKNLKEFYLGDFYGNSDNYLNLAIAKFCPNLRKLSSGFRHNELETSKLVLNNCQYLKSINIWCVDEFLSEKRAVEAIVKCSQNIYELVLYHPPHAPHRLLHPEELEFMLQFGQTMYQKSHFLWKFIIKT
jgi:hypothetical protein